MRQLRALSFLRNVTTKQMVCLLRPVNASAYTGTNVRMMSTQKDRLELKSKFTEDDPRMPPGTRLKRLIANYGPTAVVLHIGLSLTFLGVTYLSMRYGFDAEKFLAEYNFVTEKYLTILANGGTFGLAYAVYKAMMPFRILVTLALTPRVAHRLQAAGIIKKRF